jgi:hypothetical protein
MRVPRFVASAAVVVLLGGVGTFLACIASVSGSTGYVNSNDLPDGGLRVDPQVVICGGTTCNVGVPVDADGGSLECCAGPGDGGGRCFPENTPCPPSTALVVCNEEADCVVGQICCATFFGGGDGGYVGAQCAASCPKGSAELCRTNGECPGDKCIPQQCSNGQFYEMCTLFTSATFSCVPGQVPVPDGGV